MARKARKRLGEILGVLVVQNRAHRTYYDEEVEALQTTAMVIAEMIAAGELAKLSRAGAALDLSRPMHLKGLALGEPGERQTASEATRSLITTSRSLAGTTLPAIACTLACYTP